MVEEYVRYYGVAHPEFTDQSVHAQVDFLDEDIPQ